MDVFLVVEYTSELSVLRKTTWVMSKYIFAIVDFRIGTGGYLESANSGPIF